MKFTRINLLVLLIGSLMPAVSFAQSAIVQSNNRPNVIVVVADDAGNADFGFQGSKDIFTPNIDRLAGQGAIFTQGYVSAPVCSPSRAGILTGRYQEKFGHETNIVTDSLQGLPVAEKTMADRFHEAGYLTAAFGKWHLGSGKGYRPNSRGFDYFYGFLAGGNEYFPTRAADIEHTWRKNDTVVEEKEYATDAIGRETVNFIHNHSKQPFFLYVAFNAVHSPMEAKKNIEDTITTTDNPQRKKLAAMTVSLDENVGRILNALKELGIENNTLVWFINDNGGGAYYAFDNGKFRSHKGALFEGGIRVPFAVRWPGKIDAGMKYNYPVISLDIAKTSLQACGINNSTQLDGVDLLPALKTKKPVERNSLYWRYGSSGAILNKNWKLIKVENRPRFLFNIEKDPGEEINLLQTNPNKVTELNSLYSAWEKQLVAPLWKQVDHYRISDLGYCTLAYTTKEAMAEKGFRNPVAFKIQETKIVDNVMQVIAEKKESDPDFMIKIPLALLTNEEIKTINAGKWIGKNIHMVGKVMGDNSSGYIRAEHNGQWSFE
jgi:arylsulfatase A-like enzyme